jgi:hypothetical protein
MTQRTVEIFYDHGKRSKTLCHAMAVGLSRCGVKNVMRQAAQFDGTPQADVSAFYGLRGNLLKVYEAYRKADRHTLLIDLGYWKRIEGGRLRGYHKVVVDGLQPNHYYQATRHNSTRLRKMELDIKPFDPSGEYILVAGMSAKSAGVYGLGPQEFEENVVQSLLEATDSPIVYRPKPSWPGATPIEGAAYSPPDEPVEDVLARCKLVVTHHSNVAVDAIVAGKPCVVLGDGVGLRMSSTLGDLDNPYFPSDAERLQWLSDIAWTQWNVSEIRRGKPWRHLQEEGLL